MVNATGAYADQFNTQVAQRSEHRHVFSKGVHLIVDKLVSAGLRIEEQLEDYQPADMREELIRLKEKCQPFMLLACFAGSLRIVDKEKKIFEVIPDLREQKIESDFDNYEFHSYWVSELSKS